MCECFAATISRHRSSMNLLLKKRRSTQCRYRHQWICHLLRILLIRLIIFFGCQNPDSKRNCCCCFAVSFFFARNPKPDETETNGSAINYRSLCDLFGFVYTFWGLCVMRIVCLDTMWTRSYNLTRIKSFLFLFFVSFFCSCALHGGFLYRFDSI